MDHNVANPSCRERTLDCTHARCGFGPATSRGRAGNFLAKSVVSRLLCAALAIAAAQNALADEPADGKAAEEARAVDLGYKTRLVGESHSVRGDSIFAQGLPLTAFGRDRARLEEEVRGRVGPVSLLLTATESGQEARHPQGTLVVNEAYVDFGAGGNRFSAGKKILSGDVGYGFRPIDVIQRETRLQVLPPALEGIPNLTWERFSADTAWSLLLANPGSGRRGAARDDGSLASRFYRREGGTDIHGVARVSQRNGIEAGAAFSTVPNASLEVHGSLLVQSRGERQVPLAEPYSIPDLLSPDRAIETGSVNAPKKALAGFTWTTENGWSFLGEAWWDGTAPRAGDWDSLAAQTMRRNALTGAPGIPAIAVASSLAASTRMFQLQSYSRRNLLAHISWTDPAASGWSASLDLLRTLEDGGWTATAALAWEADRLRIDAGVRRFNGRANSAYRLLPERGIVFVSASVAF
jgi:hypothetical protein